MNARTKGHAYEREVVRCFKSLGFSNAVSSRSESKNRDDLKVDLCYTSPFNIQCKATETAPNMHKLLDSMPQEGRLNVVYHKRNRQGSTVTMSQDDFEEMVKMLIDANIINTQTSVL